ncbi:GntR family transcriptional regulator [Stakelama sp. CBK3Z-3]|uniref:GntR family transcriptional regulator n=1 Tax=Stakelama flava TaxID=2860338 RepID=A0ABS6XR13_9SPHN|nr:GntR family transcriptional regulator [Stakelama flava]MBW4332233.1 GntR family transcriptional regulator [Stakelama flava]
MNAAPVFDRVYSGLKQMLRQGRRSPGARLDPAALADELAASITPVRDALYRLTGERMVDGAGEGFQVPLLTEPDLRDLYAWNLQLLLAAPRPGDLPAAQIGTGPSVLIAERAEALFAGIARLSGNCEQLAAVTALNDRLYAVRICEESWFGDCEEELAALVQAESREIRVLLGRYHRRRIAAVPELLRLRYRAHG